MLFAAIVLALSVYFLSFFNYQSTIISFRVYYCGHFSWQNKNSLCLHSPVGIQCVGGIVNDMYTLFSSNFPEVRKTDCGFKKLINKQKMEQWLLIQPQIKYYYTILFIFIFIFTIILYYLIYDTTNIENSVFIYIYS